MIAYHVYIFYGKEYGPFEKIAHYYSCINHKKSNPNIPLVLITDLKSKAQFDKLNITPLYDDVITNLFDDYPYDKVSYNYWATPKIWAMSKLTCPFFIYDTDLMLHKSLLDYTDCDLVYLNREMTTLYPNPLDIHHTENWVWSDEWVSSFKNSIPMNCAVIGMLNEDLKNEYVKTYFDFVFNSNGDVSFVSNESRRLKAPFSAAQITMEQWLLAATLYYFKIKYNIHLQSKSMCNVIYAENEFYHFDINLPRTFAEEELNNTMYHLWGAKHHQYDPLHPLYSNTVQSLVDGAYIVRGSEYYELLGVDFEETLKSLIINAELHTY